MIDNEHLRAGSHFDISISISINISITKICVNRDYISITVRTAIAPAQFTSRESKMADYELEIGLLFLLRRRNRRRLLMQRQTQRKPRKVWVRDIFTRRKTIKTKNQNNRTNISMIIRTRITNHSVILLPLLHHSKPTLSCFYP